MKTFTLDVPEIAVDQQAANRQLVLSFASEPDFVAGRRAWIKYRELGVTAASKGAMRAQVILAGLGENKPSGWHLHRCDMQFLYVVSGAIHIAFSPDRIFRFEAGDSLMIPGGTIHMELGGDEGVEVIEVSVPAEMGTENCASPWGDVNIDFSTYRR